MNIFAYALKDLKNQKFRTMLGVFGVSVSLFLLSTVTFLTDSISYSYVDFLTVDSGNIDIDIHRRWLEGNQSNVEKYFDYSGMSQKIKNTTGGAINNFLPRVVEVYSVNYSNTDYIKWFYFIGLNISYEKNINFGQITETDYDFETFGIPIGNCAISVDLAEDLEISKGDVINISRGRINGLAPNVSQYMNLTVCAVFNYNLKFPSYMENIVLVDLEDIPYCFNLGNDDFGINKTGKSNHLILTLSDAEHLYDVRDISGSEIAVEAIGTAIQLVIGYNYWVDMPKLDALGGSEMISMMSSILFIFIGLISMLIAGILIMGILSTSVEEKIRQFGIFRCLGARKSFNLKLILSQGILICFLGTTFGVLSSMFFVSQILLPIRGGLFLDSSSSNMGGSAFGGGMPSFSGGITFVVQPISIIMAYTIGIVIGLLVSISPAIKVMRLEIVQAIDPYRHEENLYKLVRDQGVNYKIIFTGILLAINGGVVFFLIPRLMLSMSISLMIQTFIIILLVFLIGLTMAGIGIMPLLLRFWILVFTPFTKKLMNIIKVTIFRHERRNSSTILMFCLSFSFVMFTSSLIDIQTSQISAMIEFNRGSPLVIYRYGSGLKNPTVDFQQDLMLVEGIERTSAVIANPQELTQIYSEEEKEFGAEMGDYIGFKSNKISLYGIDENYLDTVYTQYVEFSQGSVNEAFSLLFNGSNTCIISEGLSLDLDLNIHDRVRLTFLRGDEQSFEEFTIIGVSPAMSGFSRFKPSGTFGSGNGVIISKEKYIEYMSIPEPAWVTKMFISVTEDYKSNPGIVAESIYETLGDEWNFYVYNVATRVNNMRSTFMMIQLILQAILSLTIVICMFGLFSSSYSSILERKREIGILRALGLKKDGIGRLFTVESLIIMLSAGLTGILVGFLTAALLSENMTLFTGSPRLLSFPFGLTVILFIITTTSLLIGMKFLLRKLKKQNLIEIFRETT
ncbi:MAG: ABC transporter permease [Promethearchaeota archaeon]